MSITRRARGMSILEMLIACGIGLALVGMFWVALEPTMRASATAASRVDAQETCFVAVQRMLRDLKLATPDSLSLGVAGNTAPASPGSPPGTLLQSPLLMAVHPLGGVSADGVQVWSGQLLVYHLNGTQLERWLRQDGACATNSPTVLSPSQMNAWLGGSSVRQVLATGVSACEVKVPTMTDPNWLEVRLVLSRSRYGNTAPELYELRRCVEVRNVRG